MLEWAWLIPLMLFPLFTSSTSGHFLYNQQTGEFWRVVKSWRQYFCLLCLKSAFIDVGTLCICLLHCPLVDILLLISVGVGPGFCIVRPRSSSLKDSLFLIRSFTHLIVICGLLHCLECHTSFWWVLFLGEGSMISFFQCPKQSHFMQMHDTSLYYFVLQFTLYFTKLTKSFNYLTISVLHYQEIFYKMK